MTRPTVFGPARPFGVSVGGDPDLGDVVAHDCCDPTPPPDRAVDMDAVTVNTPSTGGIVQWKVGTFHTSAAITETFDATPTNGNTMLAFLFQGGTIDTAGWTLQETGTTSDSDSLSVSVWSKVAGAAEPASVHTPLTGAVYRRLVLVEVAGSLDVHDSLDNQSGASPLVGPTLTPGSDPSILFVAFVGQVATYAGDPTWTPLGALSTDTFLRNPSTRPVTWVGHEDTTTGSYTPSLTTTPLYAGRKTASVAVVIDATPTAVEWNVVAPNTIDGDDATYDEIDGPDVLRVDLGGEFRIVRARLLIGTEDPNHVTYTIRGANAADFSDAVVLGSATFDSTGSFTADDVEFLWSTTESYRYFELSGPDENRRIYSFELYEPSSAAGEDHTHDAIEEQLDALAEAIDGLASGDFLTTTDGGGDVINTVAAAGATETIDLADGNVQDITLTANCTFTFTSPDATRARSMTMVLRQGGAGSWLATWPGSVTWLSGTPPVLQTAPAAFDLIVFVTLDGGTNWIGSHGESTPGASGAFEDLTTIETDTSLVAAPDGAGGVEWVAGGSSSEDVTFANVTTPGATETVDCQTARVHHILLDSNCVITLTGPVAAESHRLTLLLQQGGAGSKTVTWPASVYWPGASAPTLATTVNYTDWVDLITVDGGTTWLGVLNAAAYHTPAPPSGGSAGTFPLVWLNSNL